MFGIAPRELDGLLAQGCGEHIRAWNMLGHRQRDIARTGADVYYTHARLLRGDLARNVDRGAREQLGLAAWHERTGTGEHFHLDEALAFREMRKRNAIEPLLHQRGEARLPACI